MGNAASPFGDWGPIVASIVALGTVIAAIGIHVLNAVTGVGAQTGDPFLDNAALLVLGVVLGVGAIGGTATTALAEANAAHKRLDAAGAPPSSSSTVA